jgi:type IV pilus assembly protein PilW
MNMLITSLDSSAMRAQRGFTIVELMVGMVIGLIAVLVVSQIMVVSEGQKRTTTSGADSLVNGSLALFAIERDGKNAGFGISSIAGAIGCEIRMINPKVNGGNVMIFSMAPVTITNGANGAPDTISFLYSAKPGLSLPVRITQDHPPQAANFFVQSDVGVQDNDLLIAMPGACTADRWGTVIQATKSGGGPSGGGQGQNQVLHNSGQSDWNPSGGSNIMPPDKNTCSQSGYCADGDDYLINLGQMANKTYAINNNNLTLAEINVGGAVAAAALFPQIVQLQAQYGKDTDGDALNCNSAITTWDNVTPAANSPDWQKICAVRVAVVARSVQWEKEEVTADAAVSTCADPKAVCWYGGQVMALNTGNANADDWKHYRYKVFQAVIPLRNVIWRQ